MTNELILKNAGSKLIKKFAILAILVLGTLLAIPTDASQAKIPCDYYCKIERTACLSSCQDSVCEAECQAEFLVCQDLACS